MAPGTVHDNISVNVSLRILAFADPQASGLYVSRDFSCVRCNAPTMHR